MTEVLRAERPAEFEDAMRIAQELTGWTREELVNVMSNVIAETPDKLMDDIGEILDWCRQVEEKAAIVDLMKRLPAGVLHIGWQDGEPTMGFRPGLDIQVSEDGSQFRIEGVKE